MIKMYIGLEVKYP